MFENTEESASRNAGHKATRTQPIKGMFCWSYTTKAAEPQLGVHDKKQEAIVLWHSLAVPFG